MTEEHHPSGLGAFLDEVVSGTTENVYLMSGRMVNTNDLCRVVFTSVVDNSDGTKTVQLQPAPVRRRRGAPDSFGLYRFVDDVAERELTFYAEGPVWRTKDAPCDLFVRTYQTWAELMGM